MPARDSLTPIDVTELSDLAWTLVDPTGAHEDEERLWVAAVHPAANVGRLEFVAQDVVHEAYGRPDPDS